jgi:hypothetical protein
MSPQIAQKRAKEPLQAVKDTYGSLEEFAIAVLDVCPGYLEGEYGAHEAAEALDLPLTAFLRAVSTPDFNETLDRMASFSEYSFMNRQIAMRNLVSIATTAQKLTMSRSGKPVTVDRDADEIIKADTHLRKVQGRPLEKREGGGGGGITIIFGGSMQGGASEQEVVVESLDDEATSEETNRYTPNALGALPPPGARRFYGDDDDAQEKQGRISQEFDFSSEEAEGPRGTGSVAAAKTLGERNEDE